MKLYKDIIVEAWHFTTNHAMLWIFGVFSVFVIGNGGEIDRYFRYVTALVKNGSAFNPEFWTEYTWFIAVQRFGQLLLAGNVQTWLFLVGFIVSLGVVAYMVVVAQGALITATDKTQQTFVGLFQSGQRHATQLLVLNFATYATIAGFSLGLIGIVAHVNDGVLSAAQNTLMVVGTLALIPVVLICSLLSRYAAIAIVRDNQHIAQSIRRAWIVLWNNIMVTLEMAIIVLLLNIIINVAVLLITFIVVAPYLSTILTAALVTAVDQLFNGVFIFGLIYCLSVVLVGAIFSTWQWTAWTLLFKRLSTEKHTSKLVRVFSKQG